MFGPDDILKTIVCLVGTIISALCSYFVYTKLKLHKIIQWQLFGMAIHHCLAFSIFLGVLVYKFFVGSLSKTSCAIGMISGTSLFSGCQVFSSAISLSRFYIIWSTKSMKCAKNWIMITSTVLAFSFDLALITSAYTYQAYFETPGMVAACNGFKPNEFYFKTGWIKLIWMLVVAVLGVIGDLGLKRYLKAKRNEGGDVQLVPWQSGGHAEQQYSSTIPIRATLITFLTTVVFGVLVIIFTKGNRDAVIILWAMYACLQLPLIIGLTVKLNQNKVTPQQPKQQLNFHDEVFECSSHM